MRNVLTKVGNKFYPTDFLGTIINTTPRSLINLSKKIGADYYEGNDGQDKVNFDFNFLVDGNTILNVYDYKEYRILDLDENIAFHVGGRIEYETNLALEILKENLLIIT